MPRQGQQTVEDRLTEAMNRLFHETTRCLDVETSGLDWKRNHIVGYVLTFSPNPKDSYYLPFRHAAGGNIGEQRGPQDKDGWDGKVSIAEKQLLRKLDQPGTLIFGHNINFDLRFMSRPLAAAGRSIFNFSPRIEDTMINQPLLDEYQPYYNLEYCCSVAKVAAKKKGMIEQHIMGMFPDVTDAKKAMGHYWRLAGDDPVAVEYAGSDGTSTWQLRDWQTPQIAEQGLTLVHDIESRLISILVRMMVRGIKIDEERLKWLDQETKTSIEALLDVFPNNFNPKSNPQVEKWMSDHGHRDWPTTPTGKASMVESWLENYPAGQQVVGIRKLRTLRSTFIEPMIEKHLHIGHVHTSYNQLRSDEFGTVTGRLSCNDPNLQAAPKHDETIGRLYRSIFIPEGGMLWGSVDYSQCEPRLLTYYSRCVALLEGYLATPSVDAHTSASKYMCGARWDRMSAQEQKKYRDSYGKRINQTIITGGGQNVLINKYKVPPLEVADAWNAYKRAMPEIFELQREASHTLEKRGYIKSLLGRRARYRDKAYVAVNRMLQCGNADILKLKMVECDDYIRDQGNGSIDLINNVHDALDFQFEDSERGMKHYHNCLDIMVDFGPEAVIKLDVPIEVDEGTGPNWAIATYGEEK